MLNRRRYLSSIGGGEDRIINNIKLQIKEGNNFNYILVETDYPVTSNIELYIETSVREITEYIYIGDTSLDYVRMPIGKTTQILSATVNPIRDENYVYKIKIII